MAQTDKDSRINFVAGKELQRMVEQRAKQEGITVSEYIREAIILEMFFSGDLEAMGYVVKRVGKRVKAAMVDRLAGVDIKERVETLMAE